jgi:hypothetical protein
MSKTRIFKAALVAALLIPLGLMAYLGHFSRYIADDYCWAGQMRVLEPFQAFSNWYTTTEGRFTHMVLKTVLYSSGWQTAAVMPTLILGLWICAAIWTFYPICRLLRLREPRFGAVIAGLLFIYVCLDGAPSITQSLYWLGASIPYTLPLALFTLYLGVFIRALQQPRTPVWTYIVTAVGLFLLAGLSETYAVFQIAVLGLLTGVFWFSASPVRLRAVRLLGFGEVVTLIGLLIIVAAPGNAVRQAAFPPHLPLPDLAIRTLRIVAAFFATDVLIFAPRAILVGLLGSSFIVFALRPQAMPFLHPRRVRLLLGATLLGALVLFAACIAPPIYATSVAPAPRVYMLSHFVLVALAFIWGGLMVLSLRRVKPLSPRFLIGTAALLILLGPLYTTIGLINDIPQFSTYASEWDAHDAEIRAAVQQGTKSYMIRLLSYDIGEQAGLEIISPDSQNWVNQCAAQYYGLAALTGETGLNMADKHGKDGT